MDKNLQHSPGQVIQHYLVAQAIGTDPTAGADWSCFYSMMPDTPDKCLAVYDSESVLQGRFQIDGAYYERYGVQVLVRTSPTAVSVGWRKCKEITEDFEKTVNRSYVPYGGDTYRLHAISRTSAILPLGRESPSSFRFLFSMNFLVNMSIMPGTGSY